MPRLLWLKFLHFACLMADSLLMFRYRWELLKIFSSSISNLNGGCLIWRCWWLVVWVWCGLMLLAFDGWCGTWWCGCWDDVAFGGAGDVVLKWCPKLVARLAWSLSWPACMLVAWLAWFELVGLHTFLHNSRTLELNYMTSLLDSLLTGLNLKHKI